MQFKTLKFVFQFGCGSTSEEYKESDGLQGIIDINVKSILDLKKSVVLLFFFGFSLTVVFAGLIKDR